MKSCELLLLWSIIQSVNSSWWHLGTLFTKPDDTTIAHHSTDAGRCLSLDFLDVHEKQHACSQPGMLPVLALAASEGIRECQHQFAARRWNCHTYSNDTSVFGNVLQHATRERAFIYAISAATVLTTYAHSCAKGHIVSCECDQSVSRGGRAATRQKWSWGGCSHDVKAAAGFAKRFLDARERRLQAADWRVNVWNMRVGRRTVRSNVVTACKCHGVSGACELKVCWKAVAKINKISALIKDKFDGATQVEVLKHRRIRVRPRNPSHKPPTKSDLVYLRDSITYCEHNATHGSVGTRGRRCDRVSVGLDGCGLLCCGRGHVTRVTQEFRDCNCKFIWCCRVECKKCRRVVTTYICK